MESVVQSRADLRLQRPTPPTPRQLETGVALVVVAGAGAKAVGPLEVEGDARDTERRLLQAEIAVAVVVVADAGIDTEIPHVRREQVELSGELAALPVGDVVVSELRLLANLHERGFVQVRAGAVGELGLRSHAAPGQRHGIRRQGEHVFVGILVDPVHVTAVVTGVASPERHRLQAGPRRIRREGAARVGVHKRAHWYARC